MIPECTATAPCPPGYLCEQHVCLEGCLADEECPEGHKCLDARCVLFKEECNCPAAPEFCAPDINPNSATFGQDLCVSSFTEGGLAMFFGSIRCAHCWNNFQEAVKLREVLEAEGEAPHLLFIHLSTVEGSPELVAEKMGWAVDPVVHDREDLAIWDGFGADWYHLVFVDGFGCVAGHFGPVTPESFEGESGEELLSVWRQSLSGECSGPAVPEPAPDIRSFDLSPAFDVHVPPEVGDTGFHQEPDAAAEQVDSIGGDLPLSDLDLDSGAEPFPDVAVDQVQETDGGFPDGETFELPDHCQVVETQPVDVGEPVPYFVCKDLNDASPTSGQIFSLWSLQEIVWIAYFGACT